MPIEKKKKNYTLRTTQSLTIEEKELEGFESTSKPKTTSKKNRTKKTRHSKKKTKEESDV